MDVSPVTPTSTAASATDQGELAAASTVSCDTGCDDGDPCTEDECVEAACTHAVVAGCTIYACNSLGVMDAEVLADLDDGALWKASASPVVSEESGECSSEICDEGSPCCNTCPTTLGLALEGGLLTAVSTDQNVPWSCSVDECGETSVCAPLSLEVAYWLWGRADRTDDSLEHVVQGWCLQTTSETLPGVYTGSWVSGAGEAHMIQLTIEHMGSWSIAIKDLRDCPTCAFVVPMQFASGIAIRDGGLDFTISVCDDAGACTSGDLAVSVSLSSHRDQLIGTFEEQQNFGGGFGAPYAGAVGLERLVP
jgi:hypothetical protein